MRKLFVFSVLAAASLSVAAQQDKAPQKADQKAAQEAPIPPERVRADGAAGGTAPVPAEKRRAVGAGAGPHLRDNLPSPTELPRDKPVEPSK